MASLVADYGESSGTDNSSEDSESEKITKKRKPFENQYLKNHVSSVAHVNKFLKLIFGTVNIAEQLDSVCRRNIALHNEKVRNNRPSNVDSKKLPLPKFGEEGILINSVFANPFVEAENAKSAILEKHVKMIPAQDNITQINGKQICWMYRKGRCRFGHNCKYAHDSDLYNTSSLEASETVDSSIICDTLSNIVDNSVNVESDDCDNQKKKKRPGLSETLVPSKKYMNMYKRQKLHDSNMKSVKKV